LPRGDRGPGTRGQLSQIWGIRRPDARGVGTGPACAASVGVGVAFASRIPFGKTVGTPMSSFMPRLRFCSRQKNLAVDWRNTHVEDVALARIVGRVLLDLLQRLHRRRGRTRRSVRALGEAPLRAQTA